MNLLIVDDEKHIVNYLVSLVENSLDVDVDIQKSYSAESALSILSAQKIDLLLLDIHMPGCSGLELAKIVNSSWPRCHIIFLTAYDNFDSIYQANQFSHTSYLLKTESDETILAEVRKNLHELEQEIQTEKLVDDAHNKTLLLNHLLHQNILKAVLSTPNINHLKGELRLVGSAFHMDLSKPVFLAYTILHLRSIQEYQDHLSALPLEYLCPTDELLQDVFSYAVLVQNHGCMLWFFQPTEKFEQAIQSEITFLKGFAEDLIHYSITTLHRNLNMIIYPDAIGWNAASNISIQLQEQLEMNAPKDIHLRSYVSLFKKDQKKTDVPLHNRGQVEQNMNALSFYLFQNTPAEYAQILETLHQECRLFRSMHSLDACCIYMNISSTLLSYINLHQLQEKLVTLIAIYPLYYLADFSNWDDAFSYLKNLSQHLFQLISCQTTDKNDTVIQKIKNHIHEHLSEPISLAALSCVVNYNESYISHLFRQNTGEKLSEYIYQARITKAKGLLATSVDSILSISAATGFDSQQYFSLSFKKSVGISPSEYRRLHYS